MKRPKTSNLPSSNDYILQKTPHCKPCNLLLRNYLFHLRCHLQCTTCGTIFSVPEVTSSISLYHLVLGNVIKYRIYLVYWYNLEVTVSYIAVEPRQEDVSYFS